MSRALGDFLVPMGTTDEQAMIADVVASLNEAFPLGEHADPRGVWDQLVELGAHAALLDDGDDSLGMEDLLVIAERLGAGLNAETFLWGGIVVPSLLRRADGSDAATDAAARIAAGALPTVALPADPAHGDDGLTLDGSVVNGHVRAVPYRDSADLLLALADSDGARVLVEVIDPAAVRWTDRESFDLRTPLADGRLDSVPVTVLGRIPDDLVSVLATALLVQSAAVAGSAQRALTDAVDYSRVREQFGVPIAHFQAVRHRLAEALVELELMRATLRRAARTDDDDAALLASYHCLTTAAAIARTNIQVHGGIGYTWEHTAHRHYRYAFAARQAVCSLEALERHLMDTVIGGGVA